MATIANIVLLLLMMMYVFAIWGYYQYGSDLQADRKYWGDLGTAMMTLWVYTTVPPQ